MSATEPSIALTKVAAQAAADKFAQDIVAIDVSERLAITDIFLVASASSERQVNAIVDAVEDALLAIDRKPDRREGRREGRWVLLDFGDVVVHVQHEEDRVFYALERLYSDSPTVELELDASASGSAAG